MIPLGGQQSATFANGAISHLHPSLWYYTIGVRIIPTDSSLAGNHSVDSPALTFGQEVG